MCSVLLYWYKHSNCVSVYLLRSGWVSVSIPRFGAFVAVSIAFCAPWTETTWDVTVAIRTVTALVCLSLIGSGFVCLCIYHSIGWYILYTARINSTATHALYICWMTVIKHSSYIQHFPHSHMLFLLFAYIQLVSTGPKILSLNSTMIWATMPTWTSKCSHPQMSHMNKSWTQAHFHGFFQRCVHVADDSTAEAWKSVTIEWAPEGHQSTAAAPEAVPTAKVQRPRFNERTQRKCPAAAVCRWYSQHQQWQF